MRYVIKLVHVLGVCLPVYLYVFRYLKYLRVYPSSLSLSPSSPLSLSLSVCPPPPPSLSLARRLVFDFHSVYPSSLSLSPSSPLSLSLSVCPPPPPPPLSHLLAVSSLTFTVCIQATNRPTNESESSSVS